MLRACAQCALFVKLVFAAQISGALANSGILEVLEAFLVQIRLAMQLLESECLPTMVASKSQFYIATRS